jgi:hypothetical protein
MGLSLLFRQYLNKVGGCKECIMYVELPVGQAIHERTRVHQIRVEGQQAIHLAVIRKVDYKFLAVIRKVDYKFLASIAQSTCLLFQLPQYWSSPPRICNKKELSGSLCPENICCFRIHSIFL